MSDRKMPWGEEAPLIEPTELPGWILHEDDQLLILNKPGWVVCHPSKRGPWSSLVGAAREYTGLSAVHLINRLDRETSGVVVLGKNPAAASRMQRALERRETEKTYLAILTGHLEARREVSAALEPDPESTVTVRQRVGRTGGGQKAQTTFIPLVARGGYSLVKVIPHTGRKHQIRAHALWIGLPVVGDKLYGPDETLYLEFAEHGWTERHAAMLPLYRQALHCARMGFRVAFQDLIYHAPLPEDLREFALGRMGLAAEELQTLEEAIARGPASFA